eukprot:TRINITY_DN2219_c1_g2_i1.p1 TRINITY_DN2219_c1_g2~~TRINITY_DN2219_c1_g2_i1.p1  ORF type:complete len:841 (+),score=130.48 TRINITY_DN2219_c1_g2_i1:40-2523(+)
MGTQKRTNTEDSISLAQELTALQGLKAAGCLTEEQFELAKNAVIQKFMKELPGNANNAGHPKDWVLQIFWDMANCGISDSVIEQGKIVQLIQTLKRRVTQALGNPDFDAETAPFRGHVYYHDWGHKPAEWLEDLRTMGFSHVDPGTKRGSDDHKMISDVSQLAIDKTVNSAMTVVVIITGDRDFRGCIQTLHTGGFDKTILVHNTFARKSFIANAKYSFIWEDVRNEVAPKKQIKGKNNNNRSGPHATNIKEKILQLKIAKNGKSSDPSSATIFKERLQRQLESMETGSPSTITGIKEWIEKTKSENGNANIGEKLDQAVKKKQQQEREKLQRVVTPKVAVSFCNGNHNNAKRKSDAPHNVELLPPKSKVTLPEAPKLKHTDITPEHVFYDIVQFALNKSATHEEGRVIVDRCLNKIHDVLGSFEDVEGSTLRTRSAHSLDYLRMMTLEIEPLLEVLIKSDSISGEWTKVIKLLNLLSVHHEDVTEVLIGGGTGTDNESITVPSTLDMRQDPKLSQYHRSLKGIIHELRTELVGECCFTSLSLFQNHIRNIHSGDDKATITAVLAICVDYLSTHYDCGNVCSSFLYKLPEILANIDGTEIPMKYPAVLPTIIDLLKSTNPSPQVLSPLVCGLNKHWANRRQKKFVCDYVFHTLDTLLGDYSSPREISAGLSILLECGPRLDTRGPYIVKLNKIMKRLRVRCTNNEFTTALRWEFLRIETRRSWGWANSEEQRDRLVGADADTMERTASSVLSGMWNIETASTVRKLFATRYPTISFKGDTISCTADASMSQATLLIRNLRQLEAEFNSRSTGDSNDEDTLLSELEGC